MSSVRERHSEHGEAPVGSPIGRARHVLAELRSAVSAIIAALPERPERAIDLTRQLSLDRSLGWKLHRVASGEDRLPAPQHIPGERGFAIFLASARQAGVDDASIERARTAYGEFVSVVTELGGDRATGDIVLSELTEEGRVRRDLALRRALYRANSQLLGVQVRRFRQITMAFPPAPGWSPTFAQLRGAFGYRCLREGATWTFGRIMVVTTHDRRPQVGNLRTALDEVPAGSAPVVAQLCAGHPSLVRRTEVEPGISEDEILPVAIGSESARDIVLGERIGAARSDMSADAVTTNVVMPMERLTVDLLLHREFGSDLPSVDVFTTILDPKPWADRAGRDRLPIEILPTPLRTEAATRASRRDPMLDYLFEAVGESRRDFVGHRIELRFPPVPCSIVMGFPLPEPSPDASSSSDALRSNGVTPVGHDPSKPV